MTNEQLVQFIQEGDKDLIPVLYQRVKKLIFMLSDNYYRQYVERFNACGVELSDLRQECYGAFLKAVEGFKPAKDIKFTSYLNYPVRNAGAELLGIHNSKRENKSPLDNCTSLDEPIENADNDNCTLLDLVADNTSEQPYEDILQRIEDEQTRAVLHKALNKLSEQQRDVLVKLFFGEMTQEQVGKLYGVSGERIRQIKLKALRLLRADKDLCLLRAEQRIDRKLHFSSREYSKAYLQAQEQIQDIFKRGSYLTYGQRQAILFDCQVRATAEHNKLYASICELEDLLINSKITCDDYYRYKESGLTISKYNMICRLCK